VVIALLIAVVTGVTGAYVWAGSDDGRLRQSQPTPPSTVARAQDAPPPEETTSTTRPDLEPDAVARKLGPSVWTVNTLNSAGQPVQGSAFVVGSSGSQGLLLTSLAVVEASTQRPGPDITVVGAGFNGTAGLWTWDEGRDLALLVVDRAAPAPAWAADSARLAPGDRVFAVGRGGKVSPGVVTGITPGAVQHNVFVDDVLRGGPLVNAKGDVVAMASAAYTAGGKATDTAFFGVPIQTVCGGVLRCGGTNAPGTDPGAGTTSTTRRAPATTRPG
jgi:S1-C subfamily serine protease